jgi:hypothetical protein
MDLNDEFSQEAEFDPVEIYRKGVVFLDVKRIQQAVDMGVDVNTSYTDYYYTHPLQKLLCEHSYLYSEFPSPSYAKEREQVAQIVPIILSGHNDFLTRDSYGCNLTDQILGGSYLFASDLNLVADTLISNVKTYALAGQAYEINYGGIFIGIGNPENPYHSLRVKKMQSIEKILDIVSKKLRDPQTPDARFLVKEFPSVTQQWITPPVVPALDGLPTPSLQFVNAVRALGNATSGVLGITKSNMSLSGAEAAMDRLAITIITDPRVIHPSIKSLDTPPDSFEMN